MSIIWNHNEWKQEFDYIKEMLTKQGYDTTQMELRPKFEENNYFLNNYLYVTWLGVAWQGKSLTKESIDFLPDNPNIKIMIITDKPIGTSMKKLTNIQLFDVEDCYFPIDHYFQPKITIIDEDLEAKYNCETEQLPFLDNDDKIVQYYNLKNNQKILVKRNHNYNYYRRVKWK